MVRLKSKKSFTLVEMLIAALIMAITLCGILSLYVSCIDLVSTAKNTSIATNASQGLIDQIRNTSFTQIVDNYDGLNFSVNSMPDNRGVVYIDDTNPELLRVTISISWQQKNRVIGADKNLNGILDAGEAGTNGIIDSPVQLVTLIANR